MKAKALNIRNVSIQPGESLSIALPCPDMNTCSPMHIPVHVVHGKKQGPVLIVATLMNGYEVNGTVIIQKILGLNVLKSLKGTLITLPVMNVIGLNHRLETLPEKFNLVNAFPGSEFGTFSERLAFHLTKEIFSLGTHFIELATEAPGIKSMPHVHTHLEIESARDLAMNFGAPFVLEAEIKEGLYTLMENEMPIPMIKYESGEAHRIDLEGIKVGVRGIVKIMRSLDMIPAGQRVSSTVSNRAEVIQTIVANSSGVCRFYARVGKKVKKGDLIARISDPFSTKKVEDVISSHEGIIYAGSTFSIVQEGDVIAKII